MVRKKSTPSRDVSFQRAPNKNTSKLGRRKTKLFTLGNKTFKVNISIVNEIRRQQEMTGHTIPSLPFSRLVREIAQDLEEGGTEMRYEKRALQALQEASELFLIGLFESANMCASHAKRITLRPADMRLALELRGTYNNYHV